MRRARTHNQIPFESDRQWILWPPHRDPIFWGIFSCGPDSKHVIFGRAKAVVVTGLPQTQVVELVSDIAAGVDAGVGYGQFLHQGNALCDKVAMAHLGHIVLFRYQSMKLGRGGGGGGMVAILLASR